MQLRNKLSTKQDLWSEKIFGEKIRIVNFHFRAEKILNFRAKNRTKIENSRILTIFGVQIQVKKSMNHNIFLFIFYKLNFWTQFENYSVNR